MKKYKLIILFIIIILIVYIISGVYSLNMHENIHKKIYNYYGCDAIIKYNAKWYGIEGTTFANCSKEHELMQVQNMFNEIITYNFNVLEFMITLYFVIYILFKSKLSGK